MALLAVLVVSSCGGRSAAAAPRPAVDSARALIEASGVKGGLVVVIGCEGPALLADLQAAGPYLVHGPE